MYSHTTVPRKTIVCLATQLTYFSWLPPSVESSWETGGPDSEFPTEELLLDIAMISKWAFHTCVSSEEPNFVFIDDNSRPHWTLVVEELLESEGITRMNWFSYSKLVDIINVYV